MTAIQDLSFAISSIEKLKKHKIDLNNKLGDLDRQVNDHYHIIELIPLNASELSTVTKNLRALLKTRRELKEKVIAVSNFLSSIVEKTKSLDIYELNAQNREKKYLEEALVSYEKTFGKKKKIKLLTPISIKSAIESMINN